MKNVTLEDLEKSKQGYLVQLQDLKNKMYMLEGALQATDMLIKFAKEEIQMESIDPK